MPHCVIEYSETVAEQVDIEQLVDAVHHAAMDSGLFPEDDIKTRAHSYRYYRSGETRDSFVHVSVHLLDGRDDTQKGQLSDCVMARIEPMLPGVNRVGVEICDIHRASYRKRVLDQDQT